MDEGQRATVVELVAEVLGLSEVDRRSGWGRASPPGRFAATVIRLSPNLLHRYQEQAAAAQVGAVGMKVFKTTADWLVG
jgi:hypothetical protein